MEEINLPANIVEDLELKKSEYLADFLERRSEDDIEIEKFLERINPLSKFIPWMFQIVT